ncbi:hypothetical protein E2C01_097477 [Portunus trituberculatus]|uniref:Uncharacterized protein n=1 Tax=Portunus trituberculatus TaxID=210409 RepID=A0A5B7K9P9_PORTR|nr:hypothetical protein [Portunus trituberculatus]
MGQDSSYSCPLPDTTTTTTTTTSTTTITTLPPTPLLPPCKVNDRRCKPRLQCVPHLSSSGYKKNMKLLTGSNGKTCRKTRSFISDLKIETRKGWMKEIGRNVKKKERIMGQKIEARKEG